EDLTCLHTEELQRDVAFMARRVKESTEDRVREAADMAKHAEELAREGFDTSAITLDEALRASPPKSISVEGNTGFFDSVRAGYTQDSVLGKVIGRPEAFPQFTLNDGLLYCDTAQGKQVLCIPRVPEKEGGRRLNELVLDEAHTTIGHYGESRTSEYVRRWFWW
ncbi:hypothetical protein B0H11DRAFT_1650597, partial [Mycena galericulata]